MGGTECCKMTSFGVVELIQTCVALFVGPTMLGVMVLRDILAEMGDFSTFSCFWVKPTIVDRVSVGTGPYFQYRVENLLSRDHANWHIYIIFVRVSSFPQLSSSY